MANSNVLIGARELFRVGYKSVGGATTLGVSPNHERARKLFDKGYFRLDLVLEGKDGNIILVNLVGLVGEGFFKSGIDCYKMRGYSSIREDTSDKRGGVKDHSFTGG